MFVHQATSYHRLHASEKLQRPSNPKQNPTHNHNRHTRRPPRPSTPRTTPRSTPAPTRSRLTNTNRRRLNPRKIPHSHIPRIRHAILRRRCSSLTRILRNRIETDFRRAGSLSRCDDYVVGDGSADAAVG